MIDQDAVTACADLVGRAGAAEFEVGYVHEGVPVEQAGWYAQAMYKGIKIRIIAADEKGPAEACDALARRLLTGAQCHHCKGLVALSDDGAFAYKSATLVDGRHVTAAEAATWPQCRWRRMGEKWVRGCEKTHPSGRTREGTVGVSGEVAAE